MRKFEVYHGYDKNRHCTVKAKRWRKKWFSEDITFFNGLRRVAFVTDVYKIVEGQESE